MFRWLLTSAVVVILAAGAFYLLVGSPHPVEQTAERTKTDAAKSNVANKQALKNVVQAAELPKAAAPPDRAEPAVNLPLNAQPLVAIGGRVTPIDKQEVPAQHDGQILFIGTEITPAEAAKLPPERIIKARVGSLWIQLAPGEKEKDRIPEGAIRRWEVPVYRPGDRDERYTTSAREVREYRRLRDDEDVNIKGNEAEGQRFDAQRVQLLPEYRHFRRLQEGDEVAEGQLLGVINPSLALDDLAIKLAKLHASVADLVTSEKTRDEAEERFKTSRDLYFKSRIAESLESMRGAKLTWERYIYEAISKTQAISVATAELKQAETTLDMHMLRSRIPGVIKNVYKNKGDAVKNLDPVLQVFNPKKLRIEGLVEMQYVGLLAENMEVVVEPSRFMRHEKLVRGHLHEITAVAVSKKNEIVSASEDHNVIVWDRAGNQKMKLEHPTSVRAVACSPVDSTANWCLTGSGDGIGRLYDLDALGGTPVQKLTGGHSGNINCVAFSPNGKWCVTGGDDKAICLWDTATGNIIQRFVGGQRNLSAEAANTAGGHRGAVTSLAFLSGNRLVSAGKDNMLLVWTLQNDGSKTGPPLPMDRRSGEVATLGVNPSKQEVLFDYGRELRVLTVPDQSTRGILQTPSGAMNFSTMAQFSPDGNLILTASGTEGRLQLWRAPTEQRRAHELFQMISPAGPATCGAFAPDGSFLVTGTRDRQLLIWKAPTKEEMAEMKATVKLIEKALDSNSGQVRIWADLKEGQGLVPGATATLVVYP
jgi:WD40 repeat protein